MYTTEEFEQFVKERVFPVLENEMRVSGSITPTTILFNTKDETGKSCDPVEVLIVKVSGSFGEAEQDSYATHIRKVVGDRGSIALVYLAEAFTVKAMPGESDPIYAEAVKDHPRMEEVVILTLEHVAYPEMSKIWMSPITAKGDARVLGPIENQGMAKSEGKFTNLLRNKKPGDRPTITA